MKINKFFPNFKLKSFHFLPNLNNNFIQNNKFLNKQYFSSFNNLNNNNNTSLFNTNNTTFKIKTNDNSNNMMVIQKRYSHRDMKRRVKKMMKENEGELKIDDLPKNIPKASTPMANPMMSEGMSNEEKIQKNIYVGSLNKIIDDYAPPDKHPSLFSLNGLKSRKKEIVNYFISFYFYWQLRNKNKGTKIDRRNFLITAEKIYLTFNQALAARDNQMLSNITTSEHFANIKNELAKKKALPPNTRQEWVGSVKSIKLGNIRYLEMEGMKHRFCQMTAKIVSKQKVRLLKDEQIIKETDEVSLTENWVFEIIVNKEDSTWKYCGNVKSS